MGRITYKAHFLLRRGYTWTGRNPTTAQTEQNMLTSTSKPHHLTYQKTLCSWVCAWNTDPEKHSIGC